jgi:hypothetical protein
MLDGVQPPARGRVAIGYAAQICVAASFRLSLRSS